MANWPKNCESVLQTASTLGDWSVTHSRGDEQ